MVSSPAPSTSNSLTIPAADWEGGMPFFRLRPQNIPANLGVDFSPIPVLTNPGSAANARIGESGPRRLFSSAVKITLANLVLLYAGNFGILHGQHVMAFNHGAGVSPKITQLDCIKKASRFGRSLCYQSYFGCR